MCVLVSAVVCGSVCVCVIVPQPDLVPSLQRQFIAPIQYTIKAKITKPTGKLAKNKPKYLDKPALKLHLVILG